MTVSLYSYTIYHSSNAYLGTVLLRRAIAELRGVKLLRRPIYIARDRSMIITELLGGKENRTPAPTIGSIAAAGRNVSRSLSPTPIQASFTGGPSAGRFRPSTERNCRPAHFMRPMPISAISSIRPCSKTPGSKPSMSTIR